jgi:hypothetical protein
MTQRVLLLGVVFLRLYLGSCWACLDEDDETWKRVLLELNILGSLGSRT